MDTMLSKVDPGMIDNVAVIPGPYGVRYGPGFAFIDVNRTPTPRHDCFETNYDTTLNVQSNGGQIYGRETVTGGASNWGFLGSYGERDGNDYLAGNGQKMPSEYHAHDAWGEVAYDINPHQHVDFTYTRLDMADTQIPGQFFDIGELSTNGFLVRIVDDDPDATWTKLSITGWYNSTGFSGDTAGNGNGASFPVIPRVNSALTQQFANSADPTTGTPYDPTNTYQLSGFTDGFQYSTGFRMGLVFGDKDTVQLRTGADCRYLGQTINENFSVQQLPGTGTGFGPYSGLTNNTSAFSTNMPQSYMVDPGLYAELSLPVTDLWTVSLGGRVDYVRTTALSVDLRGYGSGTYQGALVGLNDDFSNTNILQRSDVLPAFYLTNRCKLDDHWLLTGGVGEAERPPSLIERYADGLFLATLQSGLGHDIGNPQLNPERDWQFDVALASNYENWRSRGSIFFAWVQNYITYTGQQVLVPAPPPGSTNTTPFPDARVLTFANTPIASLAGFEIWEEYDVNEYLTPFARMYYTEGTDDSLGGPLPGMSPLNSMVGLRIHDAEKGRHWGLEGTAQIVARQTKLGEILENGVATPVETPTDAFTVCNLRGYYNYSKNLSFVAGIDNVFNTNYQTALDIRYQAATFTSGNGQANYAPLKVLEPGISPYFGLNWKF
jgi:outer membrane receptor protein involved in Fe transport